LPYAVSQKLEVYAENGRFPQEELDKIVQLVKSEIGIKGPNERIVKVDGANHYALKSTDLAIEYPAPGTKYFLSFRPCDNSGIFLLMRIQSTDGWVKNTINTAIQRNLAYQHKKGNEEIKAWHESSNGQVYVKVSNEIYLIKDPLRPYLIQIGGLRAERPNAQPGVISAEISERDLAFLPIGQKWLSMTLAEIMTSEDSLKHLYDQVLMSNDLSEDAKSIILSLIGKNQNSPQYIQKSTCVFCDREFRELRRISSQDQEDKYGAYLIANDFPFGPYFHYIVITTEAVHAWTDLSYKQIRGLNLLVHEYLQDDSNLNGATGIHFGLNSTARHLVLTHRALSSAGASIPHIHKQVWGTSLPITSNLSEQLIEVSQAYWNQGIDYQGLYLKALEDSGYVIWRDDEVTLYVPYGQCSIYELQAMMNKPCSNLLSLKEKQVRSLSKAEYIVIRIFKSLDINSFNQVFISKLTHDNRAPKFRMVEAFVTREVDLAVSELTMLFVVDQHPWDSRERIVVEWNRMESKILEEIQAEEDKYIAKYEV
jgi:hypothetical protein